jgi:lysozyme
MSSKLSFHISRADGFDDKIFGLLEQMQPSVVKVFEMNSEMNIDEIRRRCPGTLIVYRQYTDLGLDSTADAFVAEMDAQGTLAKLGRRGVIFEGLNEPILKTLADAQKCNKWFARFAKILHDRGEKVGTFSFSTSNPPPALVPALAEAAAMADYHTLHEYKDPVYGGGLLGYRAFWAAMPAYARRPIIITEGPGIDDGGNNGWLKYLTVEQYMALIAAYDAEALRNDYMLGATQFQYGPGAPFGSFNVMSIGRQIADYVVRSGGGWHVPVFVPNPIPPKPPTPPGGVQMDNGPVIALLQDLEKFSPKPYKEPNGTWSIGYGHNGVTADHFPITIDEALAQLREDVKPRGQAVATNVKVKLTLEQYTALVSLTYNIGIGAFKGSELLIKLNRSDYAGAAAEFDRWVHGGVPLVVLPGLVSRRAREKKLFCTT